MNQTFMIFDGPGNYPDSVVEFTKFRSFELRQMFAYLREREMILQKDCERFKGMPEFELYLFELRIIESVIIWMAHNVAGNIPEDNKPRTRRRRNG